MTNEKNRVNNCTKGIVEQCKDTGDLYVNGKLYATFDDIVKTVSAELFKNNNKIMICFNRNNMVYFKVINKSAFMANPKAFMYFNGKVEYFGYCFRFISSYENVYMNLPDALDKNGKPYTIKQAEYAEKYNHFIIENAVNYGNISEYHVSHNIKDITEKTRAKKHDVTSRYITINGNKSKCSVSFELKTSVAGHNKGLTNLISYNANKVIKPLSGGYNKTNEFIRFWL